MAAAVTGAKPVADGTYAVGDEAECANCGAEIIVWWDGWWVHNTHGSVLCDGEPKTPGVSSRPEV